MAGFCVNCGRELKDGEVCTCTSNLNTAPNGAKKNAAMEALKYGMDQILRVLKWPVYQGKMYVKEGNVITAGILILIQALLSGFFALIICAKVGSLISSFMGGISSFFGGASTKVNLASFKGFIFTFIFSIILSCILAAVLFAANKIIKNDVTFLQMLSSVSLRSACVIIFTLVAMIVALINPAIGLAIYFAGNIPGMIMIVRTSPSDSPVMANKLTYALMGALVVYFIVVLLFMSFGYKIYMPSSIGSLY